MRVLHVITGLGVGGAETTLLRLVAAGAAGGIEHGVVSLTDTRPLGPRFEDAGVRVRALGMRGGADLPRAVLSLRRLIQRERPHVVQTWLYHADLVGGLAAWKLGVPVLWNLRHSDLSPERNKVTTLWTVRACARLSRLPTRIISCSRRAASVHVSVGYEASRITVVPNGFDTDRFRPDPSSRADVRRELGLPPEAVLVGWVGRFHAQKDPRALVEAAARVLPDRPDVHLVLVGRGMSADNPELAAWIASAGIGSQVRLLGPREDVERLDAALDLFISSSMGEGLPNCVGEAMACGVPCVVTDAGDSAELVGDTGCVVPRGDPRALAEAWIAALDASPVRSLQMREQARLRIQEHFSLAGMRARYEEMWAEVAGSAV